MRIASLLPSATEILFELGLGDQVVGVSHECDHPPAARDLPRLTSSSIDSSAGSAEINRAVARRMTSGLSLYDVDEARLAELAPDLIVTQDTCEVCAVSLADVERAVCGLTGGSRIVSLSPASFDDVLDGITDVANAAGIAERGAELTANLRARLDRLAEAVADRPPPKVLAIEWLDPLMPAGHWTPELVRIAGGDPVLGHERAPTRATPWSEVTGAAPEVILVLPCGFPIEQTEREARALLDRPEIAGTPAAASGRVFAIDGNAYFNRPGPRLVDSAEIAAHALHGVGAAPPATALRRLA